MPRARRYDVQSRINGQTYRLFVALPPNAKPDIAYPPLYVFDANVFFGTAADAVALQTFANVISPVIVVGIGYPTEDLNEWRTRRSSDLTPTPSAKPNDNNENGGGDAFLRIIEEELKPFVESRYKIDRSRRVIFGMSYGGLLVLHTSFATRPLSKPTSSQALRFRGTTATSLRTKRLSQGAREPAKFSSRYYSPRRAMSRRAW